MALKNDFRRIVVVFDCLLPYNTSFQNHANSKNVLSNHDANS